MPYTTAGATDDWPYLYLQSRRIPVLYYLLASLLLILLILFGGNSIRPSSSFAVMAALALFLGAAFLLLEVQNISKASVVLGNTWLVNAVIISAVLIMILLVNAIVAIASKIPAGIVYSLLCGSCLALYFIDLSRFALCPMARKLLWSVP